MVHEIMSQIAMCAVSGTRSRTRRPTGIHPIWGVAVSVKPIECLYAQTCISIHLKQIFAVSRGYLRNIPIRYSMKVGYVYLQADNNYNL